MVQNQPQFRNWHSSQMRKYHKISLHPFIHLCFNWTIDLQICEEGQYCRRVQYWIQQYPYCNYNIIKSISGWILAYQSFSLHKVIKRWSYLLSHLQWRIFKIIWQYGMWYLGCISLFFKFSCSHGLACTQPSHCDHGKCLWWQLLDLIQFD